MKKGLIFVVLIIIFLCVQFSYIQYFKPPAPRPPAPRPPAFRYISYGVHNCYSCRLTSPSTNEPDYDLPNYSDLYPNQELADYSDGQQSFNSTGTDTFVFLHIQKTGGTTLGRRFVEDIGKSINDRDYHIVNI